MSTVPSNFLKWYHDKGRPNMVETEPLYRKEGNPAGAYTRDQLRLFIKSIKNELPIIGAKQPKVLYFDIESTGLSADFGIMLMYAYQWHGQEEIHCRTLLDTPETGDLPPEKRDRQLVKELGDLLDKADIIVAHYGSKFDCRFLQTRLLMHGFPISDIRWAKIFDPCITARKQLKFQSNRMANIAEALGVEAQKSSIPKNIWYRSHTFDGHWFTDAIDLMKTYCIQDVKVLYQISQAMRPLCRHLPAYRLMSQIDADIRICRDCGGELTYRGLYHTKSNSYQNFRCVSCGAWQRGDVIVSGKVAKGVRTIY